MLHLFKFKIPQDKFSQILLENNIESGIVIYPDSTKTNYIRKGNKYKEYMKHGTTVTVYPTVHDMDENTQSVFKPHI